MSDDDDSGVLHTMSDDDCDTQCGRINPDVAANYGLASNENGGAYKRGVAYNVVTKLKVCTAINNQGSGLNISGVARECGVSRSFVRKVWGEMLCNDGRVIDPDHTPQERARGPGVKTFDEFDHCVLIFLYLEEFSRSNASYVENLLLITGTKTSTSTISRWFKDFFPISGNFRKPNLVPIDKFKPTNLWKADEYLAALAIICPKKLRFGDEKLIKGSEVYCRKTRRNVLTGKLNCKRCSFH